MSRSSVKAVFDGKPRASLDPQLKGVLRSLPWALRALAEFLIANCFTFEIRSRQFPMDVGVVIPFYNLTVFSSTDMDHKVVDVAYGPGTFGYEEGLLETYGLDAVKEVTAMLSPVEIYHDNSGNYRVLFELGEGHYAVVKYIKTTFSKERDDIKYKAKTVKFWHTENLYYTISRWHTDIVVLDGRRRCLLVTKATIDIIHELDEVAAALTEAAKCQ